MDRIEKKRGRKPQPVPQDIAEDMLLHIASGRTLRDFCRQDGRPSWVAVYDWLDKDNDLALRFAHARELGQDAIAQECLDIADNSANDWMERQGEKSAGYVLNGDHVKRCALRIDTRLKLLAKWNPKKWGEKIDHTTDGKAMQLAPLVCPPLATTDK